MARILLASVVLSCLFFKTVNAASVTIDFDAADQFLPYSEDGYTLTGNALDGTPGPPVGAAHFFELKNAELTDRILRAAEGADFTKDDGGLFSLRSFQYRSVHNQPRFFELLSDRFEILGFRNGALLVDYGSFETFSNSVQTQMFNDGTLLDMLRIVGVQPWDAPAAWDNFVFDAHINAIPLPAGLPLLGTGLAWLWMMRRRQET